MPPELTEALTLIATGMVVGVAAVVAIAWWRSQLPFNARLSMALAGVSAIVYVLLQVGVVARSIPEPFLSGLALVSASAPGFWWMAIIAMFGEWKLRWWSFAPAAVLALMQVIYAFQDLGPTFEVFVAVLAIHALSVIIRSAQADLNERRRKMRWELLGAFGFLAAIVLAVEIVLIAKLDTLYAGSRLLLYSAMLPAGVALLQAPALRPARPAGQAAPAATPPGLAVLQRLMDGEEAWRTESLKIGDLAALVGVPEHQLRQLINGQLGYDNFTAFLNSYRIRAAQRELADPALSAKTISEIAFGVGYASLNPFNRAFMAATGETPRDFRRRVLEKTGQN